MARTAALATALFVCALSCVSAQQPAATSDATESYIVRFRAPDVKRATFTKMMAGLGAHLNALHPGSHGRSLQADVSVYRNFECSGSACAIHGMAAKLSPAALAFIKSHADVLDVAPDHIITHRMKTAAGSSGLAAAAGAARVLAASPTAVAAAATPEFTQAPAPFQLDRIDSRQGTSSSFTYTLTGQGVDIYIIDSGINLQST